MFIDIIRHCPHHMCVCVRSELNLWWGVGSAGLASSRSRCRRQGNSDVLLTSTAYEACGLFNFGKLLVTSASLLVTGALLVVTGALLVVTMFAITKKHAKLLSTQHVGNFNVQRVVLLQQSNRIALTR